MNQKTNDRAPLVVFGAGGHGRVIAEAARLAGRRVLGFVDDRSTHANPAGEGGPPLLADDDPRLGQAAFIVAIGDNADREDVSHRLVEQGHQLATVVHPAAFVSPSATVSAGVFVGPQAVVHAHAVLGHGVIVNSAAVVEHDNTVGPFSHIAPGATLGGNVGVGSRTLVGIGANVLPHTRVGDACTVGAGAVVTHDVPDGETVVGVPARHP